jgi:hypothetical protein
MARAREAKLNDEAVVLYQRRERASGFLRWRAIVAVEREQQRAARRSVAFWRGQMHAVAFYDWRRLCNKREQQLARTRKALQGYRYACWAHCFTTWASGVRARLAHAAVLSIAISRWERRFVLGAFVWLAEYAAGHAEARAAAERRRRGEEDEAAAKAAARAVEADRMAQAAAEAAALEATMMAQLEREHVSMLGGIIADCAQEIAERRSLLTTWVSSPHDAPTRQQRRPALIAMADATNFQQRGSPQSVAAAAAATTVATTTESILAAASPDHPPAAAGLSPANEPVARILRAAYPSLSPEGSVASPPAVAVADAGAMGGVQAPPAPVGASSWLAPSSAPPGTQPIAPASSVHAADAALADEVFEAIDTNHDGVLSRDEFVAYVSMSRSDGGLQPAAPVPGGVARSWATTTPCAPSLRLGHLIDTVGDRRADSMLVDTVGDGRPDSVVPLGIRRGASVFLPEGSSAPPANLAVATASNAFTTPQLTTPQVAGLIDGEFGAEVAELKSWVASVRSSKSTQPCSAQVRS